MNITIFGLGYVGTVCAGCLAARGHRVKACDVQASKVNAVNAGTSPVHEPGLTELIQAGRASGGLLATTEPREALAESELSLVCVGTPSREDGSVDTTYLERVCAEIRTFVATSARQHTVAIRSTVLPQSFHERLSPILQTGGTGSNLAVCCNPEFLRESTAIADFDHPPLIVVGESRPGDGDQLVRLYEGFPAPLRRMGISEAFMVKYASNAFHALKIAFANEIGSLCQVLGADSHQVMNAFCEERQLNISPRYLKPGGAFGGSCLPKDLRALLSMGRYQNTDTPLLAATMASNRLLIDRSVQAIVSTGKRRVGVLGLSFKDNTDDLRESPNVELVERLLGKGFEVLIHDKDVSASRIFGSNRSFVEQHLPHLASLLRPTPEEVVANCEVVVIAKPSKAYADVGIHLRQDQVLLDLVRFVPKSGTAVGRHLGLVG